MPLVLYHSKTIFLHPAKTGGTWVRNALTRSGVSWFDLGDQHANFENSKSIHPSSLRFTIVRNPFNWYASYWAYKQYEGWKGNWILGMDCASDNFNEFVSLVCSTHPRFLTNLLGEFTVNDVVVLRNESLVQGLEEVLTTVGESFDREKLVDTPRANPGACLPWFKEKVKYTKKAAEAVLSSEEFLFSTYDYSEELPCEA